MPTFFNRECDIALASNRQLTNYIHKVDDILIYASSQEELEEQFEELLKTCRKFWMTLALKKLLWAPPSQKLHYAGFLISDQKAEMCEKWAAKLAAYPEPTNRTDLAAWLGLTSQCGQWYPEVNNGSTEMCKLLNKDIPFLWTSELSEEFKKLKSILCSKIVLSSFNSEWETQLLVDSSIKFGIGYV